MSDGINRGFLKATGDWVMWLGTRMIICRAVAAWRRSREKSSGGFYHGDVHFGGWGAKTHPGEARA